jgi:hypothetical protein
VRVYQEITPPTNLVASTLDEQAFATYITNQTKSKGCPKICFTEYDFNGEEFLSKNGNQDMMYSPIPETNPRRLREYLMELNSPLKNRQRPLA